jgi:RNA polymerase sigma-70 factor, ECF subfamily
MIVPAEAEEITSGSFLEVYDAYSDGIRRFIRMLVKDPWTAEDLTQETFVRVLKGIDELAERSKMRAWIYRIALNVCRDHLRTRSARMREQREQGAAEVLDLLPSPCSTESNLIHHEMTTCIQQKVGMLPEKLRTVVWLFDFDGLSQDEIAQALGISVENVKVRLHRARRKLKSILASHCTFEKDDRNVLVCEPLH